MQSFKNYIEGFILLLEIGNSFLNQVKIILLTENFDSVF